MNYKDRSNKIKNLIERVLIKAGNSARIETEMKLSPKKNQMLLHFNYRPESGDVAGAKKLNNRGMSDHAATLWIHAAGDKTDDIEVVNAVYDVLKESPVHLELGIYQPKGRTQHKIGVPANEDNKQIVRCVLVVLAVILDTFEETTKAKERYDNWVSILKDFENEES